jgi:signal transduction histidine kinase
LAGGVAHDFNNILAAMLMQLDLLQQNPHLTMGVQESLQEVEKETMRAVRLTRQLLLFSRQEVARIGPLNLNELIANLTKMLARLLGERVTMSFAHATNDAWISADIGMMEQVVMNLCINARDAMPKGGRLTLRTERVELTSDQISLRPDARPGKFVSLSVTDTGCGMDESVKKRIFEPFFTTKGVGKGTGLGLATVFGIVKQHEGWLEVESDVGRGSCFRIYLPATASPVNKPASSKLPPKMPGGSETILLVEDEVAVRRSVGLTLRKLGYAVLEAVWKPWRRGNNTSKESICCFRTW